MANTPPPEQDPAGMKPVLDLLGQMESHLGQMANGRQAGSSASAPAADDELKTLRDELQAADQRGWEELGRFTQALEDLKSRIPELIDESVTSHFLEVEDRFHRDIKEIHTRSVESFMQSVQSKIGQRIAALETNLSAQTESMGQLREYYLKTDRNVQRLMAGLDRLTSELMRLGNSSGPTGLRAMLPSRRDRFDPRPLTYEAPASAAPGEEQAGAELRTRVRSRRLSRPSALAMPLLVLLFLIPLILIGYKFYTAGAIPGLRKASVTKTEEAAPLTGAAAQIKMANDFAGEKDYGKAESIYREVLRTDPKNREAIKELASILFRQQKYDEAAVVLKTMPPE